MGRKTKVTRQNVHQGYRVDASELEERKVMVTEEASSSLLDDQLPALTRNP